MPSIASGCFCLGPHHGTVALAARSTEGGPMTATTRARPEDLRAEHRDGFGLGEREPRLSWQLPDGAIRQLAYEVECEDGTSSRVAGPANVLLRGPFDPLTSGERREIRVRLETDRGRTDWSAPLVVEAGLLDASDWRATWVCTGAEPGEAGHRPAYRIRGEVQIDRRYDAPGCTRPPTASTNRPSTASGSASRSWRRATRSTASVPRCRRTTSPH